MRRVVLYSRPGCHLCDVAREAIEGVRARHGFAFEEVSIDGDDALELAYGIRIPVVTVDGAEAFEIEVDREALVALVRS
ncbi:MAG TPA: glutaredoxin family protein [Actinomycetota bacterium]